jgi:hypothetical protein
VILFERQLNRRRMWLAWALRAGVGAVRSGSCSPRNAGLINTVCGTLTRSAPCGRLGTSERTGDNVATSNRAGSYSGSTGSAQSVRRSPTHGRTQRAPGDEPPSRVMWMPSSLDGMDHGVTEEGAVHVMRAGNGVYPAVCSAWFPPLSMMTPPRPRCPKCCRIVEQWAAATVTRQRRTWLRRLAGALRFGLRTRPDREPTDPDGRG